jgi:hypothetical protein
MNYCTRCQSTYSQPGTCNCFAPQNVKIETSGAPFAGDPFVMEYRCPGCCKQCCDHSTTGCPVLTFPAPF